MPFTNFPEIKIQLFRALSIIELSKISGDVYHVELKYLNPTL